MNELSQRRRFKTIGVNAPEPDRLRVALHNARITLEMLPPEDRGWLEYKIAQMRRKLEGEAGPGSVVRLD